MEDKDIKEELSKSFVKILANYGGIKADTKELDHGVDLVLTSVSTYTDVNGDKSIVDNGKYVDIQIKATTVSSIRQNGKSIFYQLRGKNYNDLIKRRQLDTIPLILVLFVLPDDREKWVGIELDKLILNGFGYWFRPEVANVPLCKKNSKKSIEILKSNQTDCEFFKNIFSNTSVCQ